MFEKFVAKRYIKSKRRLSFITIISRVSTLGVSVGVAALIVVMAVFNGFGSLAKKLMLSAEPHLQIKFVSSPIKSELSKIKNFLNNNSEVDYYYKFVEGKVILGSKRQFKILTLKGIESKVFNSKKFGLKKYLTNTLITDKRGVLISLSNAVKLNARLGDEIKMTTFQSLEKSAVMLAPPKVADLRLTAIFSTPNNELNANYVFANIDDVKFLFDRKNRLSGIDVFLKDYKIASALKTKLEQLGSNNLRIVTWEDNHKRLLNMMKLERFFAFLLLSLIIFVAGFNILSSLTMSVTVKQKDIAVMRAFGVTQKSVKRIFLFEGLMIGIKGTFWGFVIGIAIYFAQYYFKIYPLDATKYVVDALPVKLDLFDLVATLVVSLAFSVFAGVYPAKQAVKLNIIDAIKWE